MLATPRPTGHERSFAAALPGPVPARVQYVDVARALGVIGVVLGHAWYQSAAERITLSFDLALFFFVSGYVYSEKYSQRPDLLAWRRLKTLYFPFVRWEFFWLALHNVLFYTGIYSGEAGYLGQTSYVYSLSDHFAAGLRILTFRGSETMAGALWFLESLFFSNVFFGLISFMLVRLFRRETEWLRALAVLACVVVGYLSNPLLANRMHLGTSLVGLLFLYWGVLYRRYEPLLLPRWYLALPAAAFVIACGGGVYLGPNSYQNPALLVTVVPAGIYASLYLARLLQHNRLLQYIGTNTIFVIGMHFLAFKLVSLVQIELYGYPSYYLSKFPVISPDHGWWIAYFICGLFLPLALKAGIDRLVALVKPSQGSSTSATA
jgi:fucose 4-O-acetylase-like acetyltransferase